MEATESRAARRSSNGTSAVKARKLPVKRKRAELGGEDYEGWWFEFRSNPPMRSWAEGLGLVVGDGPLKDSVDGTIKLVSDVLLDWNFVDEAGRDLKPTDESVGILPLDLVSMMFNLIVEGVSQAPLVNSNS